MTTYQCPKCGKISSDKTELCSTKKEITSLFVCESCNKHSRKEKSICNPVEVKPAYYCGKCGTSGAEKKSLCEPMKV